MKFGHIIIGKFLSHVEFMDGKDNAIRYRMDWYFSWYVLLAEKKCQWNLTRGIVIIVLKNSRCIYYTMIHNLISSQHIFGTWMHSQKRKRYFDKIFITSCTGSCQMTTSSATNDENLVQIMTFPLACAWVIVFTPTPMTRSSEDHQIWIRGVQSCLRCLMFCGLIDLDL